MPVETIPLILPATARGYAATVGTSAKDQQLINGVYQVSINRAVGSKAVYAQKRPGSSTGNGMSGAVSSLAVLKDYSLFTLGKFVTGDSTVKLYVSNTGNSLGTITSPVEPTTNLVLANAIVSGKWVIAFVTTANEGWFYWSDSGDALTTPEFTADRTSGSPNLTNASSIAGIYTGQLLTGTGIPAGTRVAAPPTGSTVVMTANATSTAAGMTVTKEGLSKIIDAQFPTSANSIDAMDGYFFVGTDDGSIYQSAINDPSSWASSDVINADYEGDGLRFIFKWQNYIVAAGVKGTIQYFYNAGNASGSVLSPAENLNVSGVNLMSRPVSMGGVGYCTAHTNSLFSGTLPISLYTLSGINTYQPVQSGSIWNQIISSNSMLYVDPIVMGDGNYILVRPIASTGTTTPIIYDPSTGEFSILLLGAALTSAFTDSFTKSGATTLFTWATDNTWTDSSVAYTFTAQTEPKYFGGLQGAVDHSIELIADTESSGTATLDVSDDDGANWSTVGAFDMTAAKKIIWACGWHRGARMYRVTHSANTNFRAQALKVTWK